MRNIGIVKDVFPKDLFVYAFSQVIPLLKIDLIHKNNQVKGQDSQEDKLTGMPIAFGLNWWPLDCRPLWLPVRGRLVPVLSTVPWLV